VRNPRKGYTLLEVMLVAAIGVVLAGIGYPYLSSSLSGKDSLAGKPGQLAAIDQIKGKLAEARAHAMEEGRPYRFGIVPGKGNYRFAPDTDDFWGQGGSAASSADGQKHIVVAGALASGACFCDPDSAPSNSSGNHGRDELTSDEPDRVSAGSYQALVTFLPDGTARDDGKIGVKTDGAKLVVVSLKALTGFVVSQEE
jgi:prepilin-type N-terminal cleavage/methylation domain-containing protein